MNMKDCEDKNSENYFMCHMTQEEFEERSRGKEMSPHDFNMIQPDSSKREDFYQKLAKEYLDDREYWELGPSERISIECFASWLDRRCGTRTP
jgi:hypothetical protein